MHRFADNFHEAQTEVADEVIAEFRCNPFSRQPWHVVPAAKVRRVWHHAALHGGVVLDEGLLADIEGQVLLNIHRLVANTELMGHTALPPEEVSPEAELTEEEFEQFADYAVDERGAFRLSDYGLDKLVLLAFDLYDRRKTAEERLVILDRIFQVTHCRGDLAASFVEGGTETLDAMFLT